ncbi:MAG: O-succinylbenzoic acid--CoA ligase [Cytophagales bacterium]|jgi:O-succinylbenzoic acid--CoA ligase|nr:AMP-binding protein [Bacteroidota bacterium]MBS1980130.1 AMP-binding protein [Bacteroidota bacterium]WHZ08640.1 MAG: O-succinylbenzoic acid--CoA ligase [Cytophagales bacterium]
MPFFSLNGKKISIEELKSFSGLENSEFEKSTLSFCKAWVNNQQEFSIHTSGSTGKPKEIILQRKAMEVSAQATIRALQLKPGDTALVCLDTKYIAGQMMLVRSLINGMNIVATEPSGNPLKNIDEQIEFAALVPYQLEKILNDNPQNLNRIRCAIIGGAPINFASQEKIKQSKCSIYATYGMTETISHIALQKLNGEGVQEYFEAVENIALRLDARGCLCISTNYLTNEVITNDLVELIDGKKFKWLGRIDHVINSGGVKVIPEKIESVIEHILDSLQIKKRFFVTGLPDNQLGEKVVCCLEESELQPELLKKIKDLCQAQLSKNEIPREFKFIPKFIETSTNKINRKETIFQSGY